MSLVSLKNFIATIEHFKTDHMSLFCPSGTIPGCILYIRDTSKLGTKTWSHFLSLIARFHCIYHHAHLCSEFYLPYGCLVLPLPLFFAFHAVIFSIFLFCFVLFFFVCLFDSLNYLQKDLYSCEQRS